MKILIAPNSFKECLDAKKIASCIKRGVKKAGADDQIEILPLADGGRGSCLRLSEFFGIKPYFCQTSGPLGQKVRAGCLILSKNKKAFIESSMVCGIHLVPKKNRRPLKTSSRGLGELIRKAIDKKIKHLTVFLGDNYVADCGLGMLDVLGVKFYNSKNRRLKPVAHNLPKIKYFNKNEFDRLIKDMTFTAVGNETTYLSGKNNFIKKYKKDKNINASDKIILQKGIANFSKLLNKEFNKNFLKIGGCGSSGGLGLALLSFFKADFFNGFDYIGKILQLEDKIKKADLIISGEGAYDKNSHLKLIGFLAKKTKSLNKKMFIVVGHIKNNCAKIKNVDKIYYLVKPTQINYGITNAEKLLVKAGYRLRKNLSILKFS